MQLIRGGRNRLVVVNVSAKSPLWRLLIQIRKAESPDDVVMSVGDALPKAIPSAVDNQMNAVEGIAELLKVHFFPKRLFNFLTP